MSILVSVLIPCPSSIEWRPGAFSIVEELAGFAMPEGLVDDFSWISIQFPQEARDEKVHPNRASHAKEKDP